MLQDAHVFGVICCIPYSVTYIVPHKRVGAGASNGLGALLSPPIVHLQQFWTYGHRNVLHPLFVTLVLSACVVSRSRTGQVLPSGHQALVSSFVAKAVLPELLVTYLHSANMPLIPPGLAHKEIPPVQRVRLERIPSYITTFTSGPS